jgi:hypothetical protein
MKNIILYILIILSSSISAKGIDTLNNKLLEGYIIDGQEYTLKLTESNKGKIYMSFFDGFEYRLVISSQSTQKYSIILFDIDKKILFSGTCDDYTKFLDLKFQSNIACYAEINVDGNNRTSHIFNITIGFKEISTRK